jgi:hypothetical protein
VLLRRSGDYFVCVFTTDYADYSPRREEQVMRHGNVVKSVKRTCMSGGDTSCDSAAAVVSSRTEPLL